jgi:hypothetical protein
MSDSNDKSSARPAGNARGLIDYAMRNGTVDGAGWDPTSREATGWHGWGGLLSNFRSGEDPIYSPGHYYKTSEKVWDGRDGKRDLGKTGTEIFTVPGTTSRAPIQDGALYRAKPWPDARDWLLGGDVITTRTGPNSFRNATVPSRHPFNGTVDRQFAQTPDGSIYATTIGQGRSPALLIDVLNGFAGPRIFGGQNRLAAEAVFGGKPLGGRR